MKKKKIIIKSTVNRYTEKLHKKKKELFGKKKSKPEQQNKKKKNGHLSYPTATAQHIAKKIESGPKKKKKTKQQLKIATKTHPKNICKNWSMFGKMSTNFFW